MEEINEIPVKRKNLKIRIFSCICCAVLTCSGIAEIYLACENPVSAYRNQISDINPTYKIIQTITAACVSYDNGNLCLLNLSEKYPDAHPAYSVDYFPAQQLKQYNLHSGEFAEITFSGEIYYGCFGKSVTVLDIRYCRKLSASEVFKKNLLTYQFSEIQCSPEQIVFPVLNDLCFYTPDSDMPLIKKNFHDNNGFIAD